MLLIKKYTRTRAQFERESDHPSKFEIGGDGIGAGVPVIGTSYEKN